MRFFYGCLRFFEVVLTLVDVGARSLTLVDVGRRWSTFVEGVEAVSIILSSGKGFLWSLSEWVGYLFNYSKFKKTKKKPSQSIFITLQKYFYVTTTENRIKRPKNLVNKGKGGKT